MRIWNQILLRFRSLFGRSRVETELSDELRFHLELQIGENLASGMQPDEARRQALRVIGNIEALKEECRDTRRVEWFEAAARDIRHAGRMLAAHPAFTLVAVGSLALGIGLNSALFSVVDALLLKDLPVERPERLVSIELYNPRGEHNGFSYPLFEEMRRMPVLSNSFVVQDGFERLDVVWDDGRRMAEAQVQLVSGRYFEVLGVTPVLGRAFPAEGEVAVLSHRFWKRVSGDPGILGRTFTVQQRRVTVIGIAPPEFFGESAGRAPDIWLPMTMQPALHRGASLLESANVGWLRMIARLPPEMDRMQVRAALDVFRGQLRSDPGRMGQWARGIGELTIEPAAKGLDNLRRTYSTPLRALMGAVALVLLLACANVANLLLARTTERQREISIRLAIGARRSRIVRQLMTENALIATMGGALGVLLAMWATKTLLVLVSGRSEPLPLAAEVDLRVLTFTAAVCILSCLLFGLAPALHCTRRRASLTVTNTARPSQFWGCTLVVLQIAISVLLVAGAGLFVRTLHNLRSQDLGFRAESLLQIHVNARQSGYAQHQIPALHRRVLTKVQQVPRVVSAAMASSGFSTGTSRTCCIAVEGYTFAPGENRELRTISVTPNYFQTLQLPITLGRTFSPQDIAPQPRMAIINKTMSRRYFGNASPVGRRVGWGDPPKVSYGIEIVGVVEDASIGNLREEARPLMYFPTDNGPVFFARVETNDATAAIQRSIRELDPDLLNGVLPITELINRGLITEGLMATLGSFFGALAALLAGVGLYGLLNYAVARRTREIGIRMALGATRGQIASTICGQVALLLIAGVALGVPASLAAGSLVSKLLFGVHPGDAAVLIAVVATLACVAAIAALRPTRRATTTDPMSALRDE